MLSGLFFVFAAAVVTGGARGRLKGLKRNRHNDTAADRFRGADARQVPQTGPQDHARAGESRDVWGFEDTRFTVHADGAVELTGTRYPLSGQRLPNLLPWIEKIIDAKIPLTDLNTPTYPPNIPAPREHAAFTAALGRHIDADHCSQDPIERLRHGHGQTQEEMFAIKYGNIGRLPDLIVYPAEQKHVELLVELAQVHDVCLIPYGGGTNVTEALRCLPDERRFIVSVDMARMNRVLWVDPINRMAAIEAGAVGRHIVAALAERGYTMGHEPDSIEFSTLGGWIATHASGMKKNKYGNIEDIVLDMTVVTATGVLTRSQVVPRESIGSDPQAWMFGSEGNLGIITQAVVKLYPLPEVQKFGSVLFPSFEAGLNFMYDLAQADAAPASVRLMDNLQFQLGQALKPAAVGGFKLLKSQLEKAFVVNVRGFDPERMVAATLVFEGTAQAVDAQAQTVYAIANQHRGMKAGAENGERGYQLTYGIAYIRDFVMKHYVLAESFETSVPWSRVLELCDRVKRRIQQEHSQRNLPGKPFITCRVTQVYATGVAVYFYFAYFYKGVENPSEVYAELEVAARDEILRCGGSLSHHHGVGKLRRQFLPAIMSPAALSWREQAKKSVDPTNIFGCGNTSPNN
jgi:alkyldihydroxyacetonephosphate synthase